MMNSSSSAYFIALADSHTQHGRSVFVCVCALLSLQLLLLLSISHTRFYYHEQRLRFKMLFSLSLSLTLVHLIALSLSLLCADSVQNLLYSVRKVHGTKTVQRLILIRPANDFGTALFAMRSSRRRMRARRESES